MQDHPHTLELKRKEEGGEEEDVDGMLLVREVEVMEEGMGC